MQATCATYSAECCIVHHCMQIVISEYTHLYTRRLLILSLLTCTRQLWGSLALLLLALQCILMVIANSER